MTIVFNKKSIEKEIKGYNEYLNKIWKSGVDNIEMF